jgi:hypothetical protein
MSLKTRLRELLQKVVIATEIPSPVDNDIAGICSGYDTA